MRIPPLPNIPNAPHTCPCPLFRTALPALTLPALPKLALRPCLAAASSTEPSTPPAPQRPPPLNTLAECDSSVVTPPHSTPLEALLVNLLGAATAKQPHAWAFPPHSPLIGVPVILLEAPQLREHLRHPVADTRRASAAALHQQPLGTEHARMQSRRAARRLALRLSWQSRSQALESQLGVELELSVTQKRSSARRSSS